MGFFLELDEFLVLKQHDNVVDFAREYVKEGQVAISLQIFGSPARKRGLSKEQQQEQQQQLQTLPVTLKSQCRLSLDINTKLSLDINAVVKPILRLSDLNLMKRISSVLRFLLRDDKHVVDMDGQPLNATNHNGPR